MTKARELQLQARKAPDKYIALGRTLVIANGTFTPTFGGLEGLGLSTRVNSNGGRSWPRDKNTMRRMILASRNRRLVMEQRLPRTYLP